MKNMFLLMAIRMVIGMLTKHAPEMIKDFWNSLREKAAEYVEETENTVDDWLFMVIFQSGPGSNDLAKLKEMVLEFGRNYVLGTASKLDDTVFLPIFKMIEDMGEVQEGVWIDTDTDTMIENAA